MVVRLLLYCYYRRYTRIRTLTYFWRTPARNRRTRYCSTTPRPTDFHDQTDTKIVIILFTSREKNCLGAAGNPCRFDRIFITVYTIISSGGTEICSLTLRYRPSPRDNNDIVFHGNIVAHSPSQH